MTFGERLIELRKERGFNSRSEFADYIGMPSTTLRNYETNVREPGHVFLKQMADIFHVSIDYLLCMTDDRTPYQEKSTFSKNELEHIRKYRSLDKSGQEHVDTVLAWEVEHKDHVASLLYRVNEDSGEYLNAAHEWPDATAEEKAISDATMMDDNEWK